MILLTVVLLAILYSNGETAAGGVLAFAHRLGGDAGERTVILAGQAVRSVALGVIVTALIQALLAGLGLWFCGVPHAGLLTAVAFMLGVAQLGPFLVLAPAVGWLYWTGNTGWATALLIWSVPVVVLDNVVRPILIRRGVQLPLLLIIAGVIGGLIGFGVVGLFVGPVVLAATYTLTKEWIARGQQVSVSAPVAPAEAPRCFEGGVTWDSCATMAPWSIRNGQGHAGQRFLTVLMAVVAGVVAVPDAAGPPATPWVVAHRGASAYAPENTVPAFALAAEQGATFVEFDLQRTKDGALVILHDLTLERTTDVEEVFPDRGRPGDGEGRDAPAVAAGRFHAGGGAPPRCRPLVRCQVRRDAHPDVCRDDRRGCAARPGSSSS